MDIARAVIALRALAQETRLELFRALVQAGPEGLAAGAIAEILGVPAPTLSFHLQQLNHGGLITKRRASRSLIYSVNIAGMNEMMGFLTEDCCGGRPELCQPVRGAVVDDRALQVDGRARRQRKRRRA
jgi:DNA-binding transcriptional ArsR family regulator